MNCSDEDIITIFKWHSAIFIDYKNMGKKGGVRGVPPVWANARNARLLLEKRDAKINGFIRICSEFSARGINQNLSYFVYGLFYFPRVIPVSVYSPYCDHALFDNWNKVVEGIKKEVTGNVDEAVISKIRDEMSWSDAVRQLRHGKITWVEARHGLPRWEMNKTRGSAKILQHFQEADRIFNKLMSKVNNRRSKNGI